ncbi:tRNA epoxyqueuosine(34) reductase QueG [Rhodovibrio sodomensis]|uniref:Epoxyqueuosine reductase n=1 Tax=Rhodovibrio sodomensis TaxID=1088 RepID=A0ABS1DFT3_9PROT|nr:tRNA epoxyqueuosine(34) reductase QueG [Rhodovibrio sodomensis]MBK1669331.1 tRNA epoxyqueuosine(34) reductase QueG [Rhodovibrio sodomensis]
MPDDAAPAVSNPKAAIRAQALAIGFDAVGFAPAELGADASANLQTYLDRGYHGDMGWLADTADRRGHPRQLWPEARSVVVVGQNYGPAHDPLAILEHPERGAISVYAQNRDYHDLVKKRLKRLARWMHDTLAAEAKVFVDTAPVMEKPLAAAAGLGWQGKHTNLLSRDWGNWLFLGEVFTTLALAPDGPEGDHCGSCRACLDVCPTDAFPAPYQLDASRCISYLTIEHTGHIPRELRPLMGNRIYGCDDCLAICPWNKFARRTDEDAFKGRLELTAPRLRDLATLDEAGFRQVFAASPIKRTGRARFVRNVLIAIGNSGRAELSETARGLLDDQSDLVRAAAVWAFARLADPDSLRREAARRLDLEPNPEVRAEWAAEQPDG